MKRQVDMTPQAIKARNEKRAEWAIVTLFWMNNKKEWPDECWPCE